MQFGEFLQGYGIVHVDRIGIGISTVAVEFDLEVSQQNIDVKFIAHLVPLTLAAGN
ncbi:hypothetical protein [Thermoplasma volcanium]|uniref:hypothetical protein n=1 Tax=Thermoplasma volcanium TaxID=50339 RepID=UPI0012E9B821|nr:hypothetical protein [Thermoplasma volcanium]